MEDLSPQGSKKSSHFWVTPLVLGVVTSLIASAIWEGTIPEKIIDYYGLVRQSELEGRNTGSMGPSQAISQLEARVVSLERKLAEQELHGQETQRKMEQMDESRSSIESISRPFQFEHRPVQFYSQNGRASAEQQIVVADDSIAIITAYADAGRSMRGKSALLALEISIDGNACASGQTALYKGDENELLVSAACMKDLTARPAAFTIKAIRKGRAGQPGTVHLQCAIFKKELNLAAGTADGAGGN